MEIGGSDKPANRNQWKGKRVAFLGDSISDKRRVGTKKCYWEYLAEILGIVPYVYAVNGHRMDNIIGQAGQLLKERGQQIDAVVIFVGTNDFNAGLPTGEWYDEIQSEAEVSGHRKEVRKQRRLVMNGDNFRSAINRTMQFMKDSFPDKQVILLTPLHRAYAMFSNENIQPDETFANNAGYFIDDYVTAIKEAANVWAVPVIDLNSLSGLYPLSKAHTHYFHDAETDRLHPNEIGHHRIAKTLCYQLLTLPASFDK